MTLSSAPLVSGCVCVCEREREREREGEGDSLQFLYLSHVAFDDSRKVRGLLRFSLTHNYNKYILNVYTTNFAHHSPMHTYMMDVHT